MEIRVLGCSGGIGAGHGTTSFLIDDEVLIDAGSGVNELSLDEIARIKHIFLSHCHLDHVLSIPLLIDSVFDRVEQPILVHALPHTLRALRDHLFNWVIWPDFTGLPHPESPVLALKEMEPGEILVLGDKRFEMVDVNHIVPTVGYIVQGQDSVFAFSGDTTTNDTLWERLNRLSRLDMLIVECAFANAEQTLCEMAKHYCPGLLADDLTKLEHQPEIYLTHAKPGEGEVIYQECRELINGRPLHQLSGGEVFTL